MKEETIVRDFHLGAILSITHDRLVALNHMQDVYEICNFLTGDNLFTHQLVRVHDECKAHLLTLHPQLNKISSISDADVESLKKASPDWWKVWLQIQIFGFGEYLPVTPIPVGIHQFKEPIAEAIEMMRKA